jgi:hypothetical protein
MAARIAGTQEMLKKHAFRAVLCPVAAAILSTLTLAACSANSVSAVSLSITMASAPSSVDISLDGDEQGSTVLRCSSLTPQENSLMITASKAKAMKPAVLLFLLPYRGGSNSVTALAAPVGVTESEYDMSKASVFTLDAASAEAALASVGIPFADWQAGTMSTGKFPCCE